MTGFKLNTREFEKTLNVYAGYTKRDVQTIVNTKAFYIARRAVIETPKARASEIRAFSNKLGFRAGKMAGMIINKRRGKRGEPGLYGLKMAEAVAMLKAARLRSAAFLKSGWLPAIKMLQPLAEKIGSQTIGSTVKQYGTVKGGVTPAKREWTAEAIITNLAYARHDKTAESLIKYGGPALQRAINFETASMKAYIERKLREAAKKSGIKTN